MLRIAVDCGSVLESAAQQVPGFAVGSCDLDRLETRLESSEFRRRCDGSYRPHSRNGSADRIEKEIRGTRRSRRPYIACKEFRNRLLSDYAVDSMHSLLQTFSGVRDMVSSDRRSCIITVQDELTVTIFQRCKLAGKAAILVSVPFAAGTPPAASTRRHDGRGVRPTGL